MISGLGRIAGSTLQLIGTLFQGILDHPYRSLAVVIWLGTVCGAYWLGRQAIESSPNGLPLTTYKSPKSAGESLTGTVPDLAEIGDIPPINRVDTTCVVSPKFVTKTDTVTKKVLDTSPRPTIPESRPKITLDATLETLPYGFLLLPLQDSKPTVNVSQDKTVVEAVRPDNAQFVRFSYLHPDNKFGLGVRTRIGGVYSKKHLRPSALVSPYVRYGRWKVGLGYKFSPTPENMGLNISLEWEREFL